MLINSVLTAALITFIYFTIFFITFIIIFIYLIILIIILIHSIIFLIFFITLIIITVFYTDLTVMYNSQLIKKKNTILLQICLQKQLTYSVFKKKIKF